MCALSLLRCKRRTWAFFTALQAADVGVSWVKKPAPPPTEADAAKFHGQVVVMTGTLTRWTRAQAAERLNAAGAAVVADITKETTLLVAGAEPGAKLKKAREQGIEVIDEAELVRRLGTSPIPEGVARDN
jgi:DNA ligase (NAD+)